MQSAREGDDRALGTLLRRLWPWIRKKAGYYVARSAPPIGVSSLTQEAALRLSRSIGNGKVRANESPAVKALLTRIIKNTATSAHRSAARLKRSSTSLTPEDLLPQSQEPSDQRFERAERDQHVMAAIERLPERQCQAVNLLRAGVTYPEIADQLGCSLSAVHMLLQRAKAQIAQALRDPDPR